MRFLTLILNLSYDITKYKNSEKFKYFQDSLRTVTNKTETGSGGSFIQHHNQNKNQVYCQVSFHIQGMCFGIFRKIKKTSAAKLTNININRRI